MSTDQAADAKEKLRNDALHYHRYPQPGKLEVVATKPLANQRDLALANPEPEIRPEVAREAAPDAIIATGRSDYPNQVNNVLCFPFIFRAALDVGATDINEEMKVACVNAIADLAKGASSEVVSAAYGGQTLRFGPEYLIPKPFDPRLISRICPAVAKAAMDSGVATRPIEDMETYADKLEQFVFRTGLVMKPIFDKACEEPKRVAFAEGEDDRVLFAAKVLLDDGIATPILVGRPLVISHRARKLGLEFVPSKDFEIVNPEDDDRYRDYWQTYHSIMARKGVSPDSARTIVRTNSTVIASLMVEKGDADAMICGSYGEYKWHLKYVEEVLGLCAGVRETSALSLLVLDRGPIFICDTYVSENPDADEIVDLTVRAAEKVADGAGVVRGTPCRPDSARHRQARSYHHAVGDLARAGQLGRARRDRCAGARAPRDTMTPRHAFR